MRHSAKPFARRRDVITRGPAPAPALSWAPEYPDFALPKQSVSAAATPYHFWTGLTNYAPPITGRAYFPDFAPGKHIHASQVPAVFSPHASLKHFPVNHLGWKGVYPDRIDPAQALGAARQQFYASYYQPIVVTFDPALGVPYFKVAPDIAPRPLDQRHTAPSVFYTSALPNYAVPDRAWTGVYPNTSFEHRYFVPGGIAALVELVAPGATAKPWHYYALMRAQAS